MLCYFMLLFITRISALCDITRLLFFVLITLVRWVILKKNIRYYIVPGISLLRKRWSCLTKQICERFLITLYWNRKLGISTSGFCTIYKKKKCKSSWKTQLLSFCISIFWSRIVRDRIKSSRPYFYQFIFCSLAGNCRCRKNGLNCYCKTCENSSAEFCWLSTLIDNHKFFSFILLYFFI